MKKIIVKAPATSANLGPGYDCLGLALSLHSAFTFEESDVLSISGCPQEFQNEDNLVYRAFRRLYDEAGENCPPVKLTISAEIPVARGLGSSSACIAGGLLAANEFLGKRFSKDELFYLAASMEGHPDNAAPCLYGGLTASFTEDGLPRAVPFSVCQDWIFVTVIPDYEVVTEEARKAVRQEISLSEGVYSSAHAIAMVRALETGDGKLAGLACRDILHEPYRRQLICDYDEVRGLALSGKEAAEQQGADTADAFFISGSGSTMIALTKSRACAEAVRTKVLERFPNFQVLFLHAVTEGASAIKV